MTLDDEGAEWADMHAAIAHAAKSVRSLAADTVAHGHLMAHHPIEITHENQNVLDAVRFDEAVDLKP